MAETAERRPAPPLFQVVLALAAVYVIWGSTYLAMRVAVETMPPFWMAAFRYAISGALLYAWARWRGAPRPERRHWVSATIIGALLLMIGNGGVVWAEQTVASGLASLLIATEALWIVLLQWMRRGGVRPGWRTLSGVALGFIGLGVLLGPGAGGALDLTGTLVLLIAAFSWAVGSLYAQKAPLPEASLLSTGLPMLMGGGLLFLLGIATGEPWRLEVAAISGNSWVAFAYLLVFGSLIGFTAYSWLLRNVSPTLASTYAYVNPVVAVFLGWALAGEPVTGMTVVAAAVIVTGVALITSASGKGTAGPAGAPAEAVEVGVEKEHTGRVVPLPQERRTARPGDPLQPAEEAERSPLTCGAGAR